ncbi:HAD family hydrolase [Deinococcus deserti]|uniref:Putative phosphoglycolate phosphatase (PGPase) (PGP) n=1 Tax=Deinococcus deserti (strain DSM 17065 / CIP 109153 / LMG 22923 / VCD115) TaxID=546414 RepID=C1CWR5_DEIDV|nr:HAD family hydrolase [Deinococcus deserti]ACO46632.1 putative phosphoglycolate phosphatase (PGPase) (PGP) [Deinococcus deserti VCD115]
MGDQYRGVIFDIDGTLVDSNDAHARAWVRAFADAGFEVSFGQVRPLIGMGGDQLVPRLTGIGKGHPTYEQLSEGWKRHFQHDELAQVQPQPGARALLQALQERGLKLIAGTSADEALVDGLLDIAQVRDLLTRRTTASDVEASKPEPDIVQAAVGKLGLKPVEVLMVGDTPFDIESARKAGVDAVALRCGGDDRFEGAVAVYDSPQDWLDRLADSPLA